MENPSEMMEAAAVTGNPVQSTDGTDLALQCGPEDPSGSGDVQPTDQSSVETQGDDGLHLEEGLGVLQEQGPSKGKNLEPATASEPPQQRGDSNTQLSQQVQFRCKLCQYTGKDKDEIASHFLGEHIAVEVRTIKKGEEGNEGGFVEIARIAKHGSKRRGRPRGSSQRTSCAKRDDDGVEGEEDDEDKDDKVFIQNPGQVSISSRGRRRKIPFKFAVSADDDGSHPYPRSRRHKKAKAGKYWNLLREDESFFKRHKLRVTPLEFEKRLMKLVDGWEQTWFLMKSNEDVKCEHPGCNCQLDKEEMALHAKCHCPYLEGFQCPLCEFVCVHWRNMRHHYYKEHQGKGKRLSCNQPNCQATFERFGELKRHVTSTHLKMELISQLAKNEVSSASAILASRGRSSGEDDTAVVSTDKESGSSVKKHGTDLPTSNAVDQQETVTVEGNNRGEKARGQSEVVSSSVSMLVERGGAESVQKHVTEEGSEEIKMGGLKSFMIMKDPKTPCQVESTKRRITKRRKADADSVRMDEAEPKKKRNYNKSQDFGRNLAERQRALVAFVCDLCGAKYNSVDDLEKHKGLHQETDEDGSTLMKCTECDAKLSSSGPLVEHVKQRHARLLKLHRCHLCQFASERRFDLKKHLLIHTGVKSHMCDKCGKCMSTPYNLKIHYLRLHATDEEKDIRCFELECDFRCADKAVLKDHLRQKHNLMLDHRYSSTTMQKIKLFSCEHCPYTGKKESSLRYHMRIHLEDRRHKCQLCPYASKTKNNLILHMRTHEGMQPMKCPQCDFRGATNKIISEHILNKHAGIRPYRCVVCKFTSSYSGNMWKHLHDHRNELGDDMPEEPVEIITRGVDIPAPLRPPSGRKRKPTSARSPFSPGAAPPSISIPSRTPRTMGLEALSQLIQFDNPSGGTDSEETVTILEVPINDDGNMFIGGNDGTSSTALNNLAAAVATAREVALLSKQAQAAMTGGQQTDESNPYPVTNLFQQIAGHASANTPQALTSLAGSNKLLIAVTSNSSVRHESWTSASGQPGDGQTKVTYALPQSGVQEIQLTAAQPGILGQTSQTASYTDSQTSDVNDGGILVNIGASDLQIDDSRIPGQSLQVIDHNQQIKEQSQISGAGVGQLVSMTTEGELVMSMVQTTPQANTDDQPQQGPRQPVEAHIVVGNPDDPDQQYVQYIQADDGGPVLADEAGQVVHILQGENGELVYQDSTGQMFHAQDTQIMFQDSSESSQGLLQGEIPEAIALSDEQQPGGSIDDEMASKGGSQTGEVDYAAAHGSSEDLSLGVSIENTPERNVTVEHLYAVSSRLEESAIDDASETLVVDQDDGSIDESVGKDSMLANTDDGDFHGDGNIPETDALQIDEGNPS